MWHGHLSSCTSDGQIMFCCYLKFSSTMQFCQLIGFLSGAVDSGFLF